MTNYGVAQAFANGATDGHSLNMFIEGRVIYSYGYHFPMAVITDKQWEGQTVVLFNSDGYSNTTSKHQSYTRGALATGNFVTVEVPTEILQGYIKGYLGEAEFTNLALSYLSKKEDGLWKKAKRARYLENKERWIDLAAEVKKQKSMFSNLFA